MSNKTNPAYDAIKNAIRFFNPFDLDTKYLTQTLADGATASADFYLDKNGFKKTGVQFEMSAGADITVKLWGTIQDDATDAASSTYQDITEALLGVTEQTGKFILLDNVEVASALRYLKIEVEVTSGSYTIFTKELY